MVQILMTLIWLIPVMGSIILGIKALIVTYRFPREDLDEDDNYLKVLNATGISCIYDFLMIVISGPVYSFILDDEGIWTGNNHVFVNVIEIIIIAIIIFFLCSSIYAHIRYYIKSKRYSGHIFHSFKPKRPDKMESASIDVCCLFWEMLIKTMFLLVMCAILE